MSRILSLLLISGGILLFFYGGWEIWYGRQQRMETLEIAEQIVRQDPVKAEGKEANTSIIDEHNNVIGILQIPTLQAKLPIIEGTDDDDLEKGVGHYKGTAMPKQNDQIVLSGHRDTVFREVGKLKKGDQFIIDTKEGSYTYKIKNTKIVKADDTTIISPTSPNEELVVTTCYPFSYVGNAPERYIIYAYPIE